ncbi:MAG: methyltransferase domain-containing protein [Chloroflexi bacterium]|nr:methyltransferase domain-containing protein [Chloroflexota bacterium]
MSDVKKLVQEQFGRNAEAYATSRMHSRGVSLTRVVELTAPRPGDAALDVATAAGHTALALAPHVRRVVGLDLTPQMMVPARRLAGERGVANADWMVGDVENLPLASASFEIITCRIALHHWPDAARGLREMARAAKPGARVVLIDNVAPADGHLAQFVNQFERVRDPSHNVCYPLAELAAMMDAAGLRAQSTELLDKPTDFEDWVKRMRVPDAPLRDLRAMLQTPEAAATIRPETIDGVMTFHITEAILVGVR